RPAVHATSTRLRSSRSTREPSHDPRRAAGRMRNASTTPEAIAECVRSHTRAINASVASHSPSPARSWLAQRMRKSRLWLRARTAEYLHEVRFIGSFLGGRGRVWGSLELLLH